ncbi:hypothetical protein Asppvi_006882 [Aspergillus pseudoviridinutans]|uniref:RBP protein n=1 Tax=Aspergillus pseudoviridinutans TaxID=1517512 RepID=A0A9P3BHS9_9EURO|nr:uncharacterized protein Asppvi_006882 [Aspergillus pseudoviridinutans]GIJ87966.1 hypothetical protein Asppvi_006882 [Aspergillus pseudoviridinutans]
MQALSDLPVHPLAMETPSPSKVITDDDGKNWYNWELTETERAHIASMLETTVPITRRANIMNCEREQCHNCGKHSGLDDLVHNALYGGIHSKEFMFDVLQNGPKGPSPKHSLVCSGCGNLHNGAFFWPPHWNTFW